MPEGAPVCVCVFTVFTLTQVLTQSQSQTSAMVKNRHQESLHLALNESLA